LVRYVKFSDLLDFRFSFLIPGLEDFIEFRLADPEEISKTTFPQEHSEGKVTLGAENQFQIRQAVSESSPLAVFHVSCHL